MKDSGGHKKNYGFYPKSGWNPLKGFKQKSGMIRCVFEKTCQEFCNNRKKNLGAWLNLKGWNPNDFG